jgi:PAS domain S-box-containing protein
VTFVILDAAFQRVFEGSTDAELLIDDAGRVVSASMGYLRTAQIDPTQVAGRSLVELPPYAGNQRLVQMLEGALEATRRTGVIVSNLLTDARPLATGERFGSASTRPVRDDQGRVCLFVHRFLPAPLDTPSVAPNADRHLLKLIEHSYDTMALIDRYGRFLFVSPSIHRLLGLTQQEFLERAMAGLHPDDAADLGAQITDLQSHPGALRVLRFRTRHADGSWRSLESASRNLLHDPEVSAIVANFHDVTANVELEAELRRINAELAAASSERARLLEREQQANRTKDQFLAMLGHELRNPLAPIVTALQLMEMRDPAALAKERNIIERQVQHLIGLVDDLLDVSRITRGKIELHKSTFELSSVVAKAIEMTSPLFEQRRHTLRTDVAVTGLLVHGDEMRLSQVVANLLHNAAKYTPSGGAIEISGRTRDGQALLVVRDSGRGIAPELLPRLFDPFVQSERTLDRGEGGLGLGLAIVRSLVELHGGTVAAQSAGVDQGSEFTVKLPLAEAREPAIAAKPISPAEAARTLKDGHRHVLVVDDNADAAQLLEQVLAQCGYDVRIALDGPEALAVARSFKPVLAFLDIGLPVMDGYELARQLRAEPGLAELILVAITGYGQVQDRQRSAEAGFAEHLVKPVDLTALLEVTARLLPAEHTPRRSN